MKLRRANPVSGALMGLRSAYPRGGAPRRGGVRSLECIIGAPEGIEELPSRAEERREGGSRVQNGIEER
jgi:hypothetical protein